MLNKYSQLQAYKVLISRSAIWKKAAKLHGGTLLKNVVLTFTKARISNLIHGHFVTARSRTFLMYAGIAKIDQYVA